MKRLAGLIVAVLCSTPAFAQELNERSFENYWNYILPRPAETKWLDIPWRPTLWDAVAEAQKADKPIVLWMMQGHPLCYT